jgi:hypothetical protein
MEKERCHFMDDCEYRHKCACSGNAHLLCSLTYRVGDIFFVDKQTHPACVAKTYFGDAHICLCPAQSLPLDPPSPPPC